MSARKAMGRDAARSLVVVATLCLGTSQASVDPIESLIRRSSPVVVSVDGRSAEIVPVRSERSAEESLADIERYWRGLHRVVLRDRHQAWGMLSFGTADGRVEVLQLRAERDGTSTGFHVRWQRALPASPSHEGPRLIRLSALLPPAARPLADDLASPHQLEGVQMTTAWLPMPLDAAASLLRSHAHASGAILLPAAVAPSSSPGDRALFFLFERAEIALTLHAYPGGTAIVLQATRIHP